MRSAEKNSQQTNTEKQNTAPSLALTDPNRGSPISVKIKSIKYIGKQDVYNMEVENHHNYSVDGGLIIHNCLDALRYSLEKYIKPKNNVSTQQVISNLRKMGL